VETTITKANSLMMSPRVPTIRSGHKHHDIHERNGECRKPDFIPPFHAAIERCSLSSEVMVDVFEHNDGIIHQDADDKREPRRVIRLSNNPAPTLRE